MRMRYKLAIFDMDGTILDTLEDLKNTMNYALAQSGLPERTIMEVRSFVGNGIRKLVQRAVPAGSGEDIIEQVYADFLAYYREHCADTTKPYEGIMELLQKLRDAGCKTAVVSNKGDFAVQELCVQYFPGMFDFAVGEKEGVRKKPAPDTVEETLKELHIDRKDAVYIGDSDVDLETARNAQMDHIIVEWGFRDAQFLREKGARVLVEEPWEIWNIFQGNE